MSDVFISYARSTASQAQQVAAALRSLGYSVWIDDDLPAHRAYTRVIEEQMTAARAAVVIWSADAVQSEWVLSEANRAREDRKLVQAVTDTTRLPMPFDTIQCADLAGWTGDPGAAGWRKVVGSIADLVGGPAAATPVLPPDAADSLDPLLAVLAFDNLSADPEMAFFSEGVSAEIQQTVARAPDLRVIARASSFQFRGPDKSARHVATELKVTHILDGTVRRSGSRVRISTELIRCQDEATLWSDRFDRDLTDVFALQDEIAAAVAAALKVAFGRSRPAEPIPPAAYDLFLKAQANTVLFDPLGANIPLLESATALAPSFAAAWASLSFLRAVKVRFGERGEAFAEERAAAAHAAETALRLDPTSGHALIAKSWLLPFGCYAEQEQLLRDALDQAPHDPLSLTALGTFYDTVGRTREALVSVRRAYELDPLFPPAVSLLAGFMLRAGAYEDGQKLYADARRKWPGDLSLYVPPLGWAAHAQDWNRFNSIVEAGTAVGAAAYPAWPAIIDVADALRGRRPDHVQTLLRQLESQVAATGAPDLAIMTAAYKLGMIDQVFELIDRSSYASMFEDDGANPTGHYIPGMIFDRSLNGFMRDPRFVRLCAKLGLVDYWETSGHWPDCAERGALSYDFRAECRKLVLSG